MPKLTVAGVAKYTAQAERREIPDSQAPALFLIIQPKPSNVKSWALRFRRPDGKPAKLTLGRVDPSGAESDSEPTLGGVLTLRQARQLANKIDRERARGIDVVGQHKAQKHRERTEAADRAGNSFGAAVREFFVDHKTKKWQTRPRRWRGDARLLGLRYPRDCDPTVTEPQVIAGGLAATWSARPVAEIDGHDVYAVVDDARRNGVPGLTRHNMGTSEARGRKMHAALSVLFRWLQQRRRVAVNPCVGVWHPGAPPPRDRVLSDAEVRLFWLATDAVGPTHGALLKVLLLTGARLAEVALMRRDELGEGGKTWTIPGARTKNHREHVVPLPPLARKIIARTPAVPGDYVFSIRGARPVAGFSRVKASLDEHVGGVPRWTLHDLRRTAVTGMAKLGVRPDVIELTVNHVSGSRGGIAGVYNRSELLEERRAALERWAAHVAGVASGKSAKIVPIGKTRP